MYVKIEQKLSKGFNSWKTMMLANGEKLKKYGMTVVFAGADKEDDNAMTVVIHFESPEGLKGLGMTFIIVGLMSFGFMSFGGISL